MSNSEKKSYQESLQSLVEELQTSNEELQATNEELMASNEELQSTNEELHAVKEELYTVSAEHHRKLDELKILSDDINTLLKATNMGVIFLDERLNIRRFTPSAMDTFNLLKQDEGRPFAHTTYRFEGLDLLSVVQEVAESQIVATHEMSVYNKDYILRVLPYNTSVADASGVVITVVDVTLLKEAERQRLSQKEICEEGLNKFTYLASHDLQEPLRKIQQSGELLQMDASEVLDDEGKYFLDIMTESASRMRSLIDDLLLYSASANQDLEKSDVELKPLIDAALKDIDASVQESNAKFNISKLPIVRCDAKVFQQVLVNILSNSIKYAREGVSPVIRISSRRSKEATTIRFKDNGIGMQPSENINIFEPFVRLHAKNEYSGSGIGLAVCKTICDKHGWKIRYSSELDKGTEIFIDIPNKDFS
ncbi:sensor histidine kinase [Hellea balneolensis]|uniref:sensor histidine kinase n=1 Tax=Hellea balneolensis TaxID=287478 RepID=UPI00040A67D7|nr:ATP-binding protein [Hellea balneolensis]